jgi:hypothetical protein
MSGEGEPILVETVVLEVTVPVKLYERARAAVEVTADKTGKAPASVDSMFRTGLATVIVGQEQFNRGGKAIISRRAIEAIQKVLDDARV